MQLTQNIGNDSDADYAELAAAYAKRLQGEESGWTRQLQSQLIESAWSLCDWDVLDEEVEKPHDQSFESDVGLVLSAARHQDETRVERRIRETREQLLSPLFIASAESYRRSYDVMLQLHMLHELELQLHSLSERSDDPNDIRLPSQDTPHDVDWDARLQVVTPSFKTRESAMRLRHAVENLLW